MTLANADDTADVALESVGESEIPDELDEDPDDPQPDIIKHEKKIKIACPARSEIRRGTGRTVALWQRCFDLNKRAHILLFYRQFGPFSCHSNDVFWCTFLEKHCGECPNRHFYQDRTF